MLDILYATFVLVLPSLGRHCVLRNLGENLLPLKVARRCHQKWRHERLVFPFRRALEGLPHEPPTTMLVLLRGRF